jgi:hypothetical protein
MSQAPASLISLSDESLTSICQLIKVLTPDGRSRFLESLAEELRDEPGPIGDGPTLSIRRA